MAALSDISVIIVNYRGWDTLAACLDALERCDAGGARPGVIVVDNHSADGRLASFAAAYPRVRFLELPENVGFARGNNRGAAVAEGNYFLFLNPDTVIPCEALETLLAESTARGSSLHLLSLRQVSPEGREETVERFFPSAWTVNGLVRLVYLALRGQRAARRCDDAETLRPDWVSGSVVWMTRDTFSRLGGWDEDYWLYYEDVDLCRRLQDHGGEVTLFCDPPVIHRHGGTTRQDKKKVAFFKTYVLISQHIYFRKHYRGLGGILLQLFVVTNNLLWEQLIPALAGVLLFPFGVARRHLFIYIYLLKYYFRAIALRRWNINPQDLFAGESRGI